MKLLPLLLLICSFTGFSQSIHQEDLLNHPDNGVSQVPASVSSAVTRSTCDLTKTVFGWHPYWVNGLEANYDWNLISDLCYFAYEVNAANGAATSTHNWATAAVIDTALAHNKEVHLCVTLFSQHATFFGNATAQTTLINNLVNLIQTRGAHGINIDFEGVPSSQSANLTAFMTNLGTALHTANPNYKLSLCLYAVDWNNLFDEPTLNNSVDFYTIMGYDYYYSGSAQAGPTDPLYGFTSGYDYSLSRSVSYYLNAGIPTSKLILGLPYYGREWETTTNTIPGNTTGANVFSRTYKFVRDNTSGNYINPTINTRSSSLDYIFQNAGTWRQCWLSKEDNLKDRYDLVRRRNLKGIGIWTLGYDDGYTELWDAINEKLTSCTTWACSDTLYDEGGAEVNYYNNELVEYTISPPNASSISVNFLEFATEAGFDTLWLYDGTSSAAPLIGFYEGSVGPGQFTTTGGHLTLRFKSDGATRASGWKMAYACMQDVEAPTSVISLANAWQTENTTVQFTDSDNNGVTERYWNAHSLVNGDWQGNEQTGHVFEPFSTLGNWNALVGTWELNSGSIVQIDENNTNTNVYLTTPLTGADSYLFHWKGSIAGAGASRRAGMHFMCSDLTLPNRGNSYFIWFRVDTDVIQLYEVTNDVFSLTASFPYTIDAATLYDCKVTYSTTSGELEVFVNDLYVGSWVDSTPLTQSTGISLRSANASFTVDHVAVYPSRTNTEQLLVGPTGHFTTCNPSVPVSSGGIQTILVDAAKNLGFSEQVADVDFTKPLISVPTEEIVDIDTLLNTTSLQLANLVTSDTNSGISTFVTWVEHLDGTVILSETPATSSEFFQTLSGLSSGQEYRIFVRSVNGAGLSSDTLNSDGFIYLNTLETIGFDESSAFLQIYPNPCTDFLTINAPITGKATIVSSEGKLVYEQLLNQGNNVIDVSNWQSATYFIAVGDQLIRFVKE